MKKEKDEDEISQREDQKKVEVMVFFPCGVRKKVLEEKVVKWRKEKGRGRRADGVFIG